MNRRDTLTAIAALGAIAGPLQLLAQPRTASRPFRIGFSAGAASSAEFREAFAVQMRALGWQEHQGYVVVSLQHID